MIEWAVGFILYQEFYLSPCPSHSFVANVTDLKILCA